MLRKKVLIGILAIVAGIRLGVAFLYSPQALPIYFTSVFSTFCWAVASVLEKDLNPKLF